MNISIITFTENGTKLAEKIRQAFVGTKMEEAKKLGLSLSDWTRQQFAEKNAIVVIGACGIAVRMIAPFVSDKLSDSPVVVADEAGMFVIPLLSGHMGGANELAEQIAGQIGGIPVITTATDVNHTFSVDLFAKKCGLSIYNREGIAKVSAKILDGKTPDIVISSEKTDLEQGVLGLQPREYILGIGCRRGKSFEELDAFIQKWLDHADIEKRLVRAAASIDLKRGGRPAEVVHGKPDSVFNLFRGGVKTGKGRLSGVLLCERKDRRGQCLRAGCNESGKRRRNFHFAEAGRKWYDDRNCKIRLEIGKRTGKGVQDR